eukprot:1330451-Amphidinium_carterae.1
MGNTMRKNKQNYTNVHSNVFSFQCFLFPDVTSCQSRVDLGIGLIGSGCGCGERVRLLAGEVLVDKELPYTALVKGRCQKFEC